MANTSVKMVLDIHFLIFNNTNVVFKDQEFSLRFNTFVKALSINKWMQLINQKKFAVPALDLSKKAFIIQMTYLSLKIIIHLV